MAEENAPAAVPANAPPEGAAPAHPEGAPAAPPPNEPDEKAYVEALRKAGYVTRGGKLYAKAGKEEIDLTDPKAMELLTLGAGGKRWAAERDAAKRELDNFVAGLEQAIDKDALGTWATLVRHRGQDPEKIIENYLAQREEYRKLDPRERERLDLQERTRRAEARKNELEAAEAARLNEIAKQEVIAQTTQAIEECITKYKLPDSPYVRHAMATMAHAEVDRGATRLDYDAIARAVSREVGASGMGAVKGMDAEKLIDALGEDGIKTLLGALQTRAKKREEAAKAPPAVKTERATKEAPDEADARPKTPYERPRWANGGI